LDSDNNTSHFDNKKHIIKDFNYFLLILKTCAFFRKRRFDGVKKGMVKERRKYLKEGEL